MIYLRIIFSVTLAKRTMFVSCLSTAPRILYERLKVVKVVCNFAHH